MEIYRDHRMGPKCYAAQCIVNREENLQNCLFSLVLRHSAGGGPSHGDRQHAQTFGKDRACGSGDMLTDRQTDTHTHGRAHYNTSPRLPRAKRKRKWGYFYYAIYTMYVYLKALRHGSHSFTCKLHHPLWLLYLCVPILISDQLSLSSSSSPSSSSSSSSSSGYL